MMYLLFRQSLIKNGFLPSDDLENEIYSCRFGKDILSFHFTDKKRCIISLNSKMLSEKENDFFESVEKAISFLKEKRKNKIKEIIEKVVDYIDETV